MAVDWRGAGLGPVDTALCALAARMTHGQHGMTAADLELDTSRHEVKRSGRRIELTSKEFALLEYLLRSKGSVVTRGMILDHVWDLDYHGTSNLVEVYINYLRRIAPRGSRFRMTDGVHPIVVVADGSPIAVLMPVKQ